MPTLITEDASTVSHVWINGGSLIDTKTNITWNQIGTPTFLTSAPLYLPNGVSAEGVGGFSDSNYFVSSTVSNVLDFTGNFICTIIVGSHITTPSNLRQPFCNGSNNIASSGFCLVGGSSSYPSKWGAVISGTAINTDIPSILDNVKAHIITIARSGTTVWLKIDGESIIKRTGISVTRATTTASAIGRNTATTGYAWEGAFYELYATTTTPTDAIINDIHATAGGFLADRYGWTPMAPEAMIGSTDVPNGNLATPSTIGAGTGRALRPQTTFLPENGQLFKYNISLANPGQTFTSGPTTNLWISRLVIRIIKSMWPQGIHIKSNHPRSGFGGGLN